ncbi:hypothetical protein GXM_07119 [Nostoc sphaeroides CCNUC1]|uniref:Uncharacterized protein n=1 Tax=Nostoc sphaeroides CCNUC1 TaxID=2653204 RepID=A0A5P8WA14_9NOSO|nr:hypothetical protein GXM_07119 [Nostoc sphaeroides CCNUC1]
MNVIASIEQININPQVLQTASNPYTGLYKAINELNHSLITNVRQLLTFVLAK